MQKSVLLASAALFAAAAASPAFAQGGPGQRGQRMIDTIFAKIDVNKDGKITKEEIVAYRTGLFKAADKNNDGYLEGEEIRVFLANRRFAMRDADGDGKLSAEEIGRRRAEWFKEADKNNDGFLTQDELKAARDARRADRAKRRADRAKQGADKPRMRRLQKAHKHRGRRGRGMGRWFMRLDLNKDGRISLAEYNLRGDRMVLSFDLNGDGEITKIEMRQRMAMGFGPRWGKRRGHGMKHHYRKHGGMRHYRGDAMRGHGGRPN